MAKLNEIRTSNLDKLKDSSYSKVAKSYPKDLLRLIYKSFEDAGFEVNRNNRIEAIDRFDRDMDDSMSNSNWFLDSNNSREISINNDITIRLEPKQEFIKLNVSLPMFMSMNFKFDYDDKVGKILNKIIDYTKEASSKLDPNANLENKQKIRQELLAKYGEDNEPKFIKSLKRIFGKYSFYFRRDDRDKIIYKFNFDFEEAIPGIKKYMNFDLERELNKCNLPFKMNKLQNKIYPILIKKIENNNYLLKDYRMVSDYFYLELTNKKREQKYPGANLTYGERHDKVKSVMMDRNKELLEEGREAQREIVKGILE